MSSPQPLLEPGSIFARDYVVIRPLRSGGMGSVLVVEHRSTGKLRALKLIAPELELNEDMRERFVREARAAASIDSEHVVEIISAGVDEESNRPFIVMELLTGEDLGDRLDRLGPLDHATLASVARQLGHALGAAHQQGIIHRDLKPENIFLADARRPGVEFTVKLLDFGVAKILALGSPNAATQPVGSPLFMAPEQTDSEGAIGPGTDVWSLGLLAFFLLTGEYFWITAETGNVPTLLREVCFEHLPPASMRANVLGATREALPPGFDEWFAKCVVREHEDRFANGADAANALADLLEWSSRVGEPASAGAPAEAAPPPIEEAAPAEVSPGPDTLPSGGAPDAAASVLDRRRARLQALRSSLPGVLAGCAGGALCYVAVSLAEPSTPTAAAASASAPPIAASAVKTPPQVPETTPSAPPAKQEAPTPARGAAAASPQEPKPKKARPKREPFAARPEDARCPPGMRRVAALQASFCVDASEVTVDGWAKCVEAGRCKALEGAVRFAGIRPDGVASARESCVTATSDRDLPVNCIDRASAAAHCAFRSVRLPTEVEWKTAAFGDGASPRRFPWGSSPLDPARSNVCDAACVDWAMDAGLLRTPAVPGNDGAAIIAPAGSYAAGASPDAVLDLLGNVAEWTATDDGAAGVVRGGSFLSTSAELLLERRLADPRSLSPEIGFRCAADLRPEG